MFKISNYKDNLKSNNFNIKTTWNILKQAMGKSNVKSDFPQ